MKKALVFALCLLFCPLLLCGCNMQERFTAGTNKYLIAALGFDEVGDEVRLYMEAVIVNSDDSAAEKKTELLYGGGKTLKSALGECMRAAAEPLELSHTAAAVIGESISAKRYEEICDYLYNERQITLSILLLSSPSARELLSCETVSSAAVGYDLTGLIEQYDGYTGTKSKCRLYEIENSRRKAVNVAAMPSVKAQNGKFSLDGAYVFKDGERVLKLDPSQVFLYALAVDLQTRGRANFDGKEIEIKRAKSDISYKNGKFYLTVKADTENAAIKKEVQKGIEALFLLSKSADVDLFGIGNRLYKRDKTFFEKISRDYSQFYQNACLEVRVQ